MTYPPITFDSNTDYNQVEILLKEMFSDLNAQTPNPKSTKISKVFAMALPFMEIMEFDRTNNVQRWQSDIQSAYKILQPLTSGAPVTTSNGQVLTLPFTLL